MATKNAALRNQMADDFGALWGTGTLVIRDASNNVLVTFNLGATAFGNASDGMIAASGTPLSSTATGTGTADNAILSSTEGTYQITDLSVGLSAAQVILDNLSINSGQTVNLTSFTWTESATV